MLLDPEIVVLDVFVGLTTPKVVFGCPDPTEEAYTALSYPTSGGEGNYMAALAQELHPLRPFAHRTFALRASNSGNSGFAAACLLTFKYLPPPQGSAYRQ